MKLIEYIVPIDDESRNIDEIFIGEIRKNRELIRCKDCKHSETDSNGIPFCTKFWRFMEYCSSGERR